jgi:hypothetical protein
MTMASCDSRRVPVRLVFSSVSLLTAVLWAGSASAGVWQPVGVGDCAGRDVASSRGSAPDAAKCDAGFAGQTAVCWSTGCAYKNVPTASCKGGVSPGQMYTCVASSPQPAAGPAWQPVGLGDCPGRDVGTTHGPAPDATKCNAAFAGQTAVCWTTGCTYKSVATSACTGGATPGQMYTCAVPAAPPTPAPAPAPQPTGGAWQAVGVGDCPGRDVAGSSGSNPDPSKCTAAFAGQTAVCWATGCTYKNVVTSACSGGANPGQMYTCTAATSAPPSAPPSGRRGPTAIGGWQPVGMGDCPGRDVGGTAGPTPDPSKCDAGFAGQTAVCWSNGCTYKTIATGSCSGGTSPGQMYTCNPNAFGPAAPPPPPPGPPKVNGKRYQMVNYAGEVQNPHEFIIDWNACKVAEQSPDFEHGTEDISVLVCKPNSRLVIKTEFKNTGYWAQYDWVLLDKGATLAGAYRDPAGCGPSVGKRAK